ncbi:HRDC domain-containing protein [Verrucomicrobiaceae bacterium R5-34]|uniref:HRDC domain-containing protein n=1 Tax=Oceaniferula flava TaxID=2800421 RepID=A0AAE2SA69_9BACT|nr:HRDC domain-containing protein [Oceaniferula flavus]MBK1829399.1 HRDC domain-containing protein [Verrucomicrobiaceae bacterium R5-34]MBK1853627.1 HRDC domain-containing protein [Oceaniferula flavus]MBM1134932.1 HRDC domain-containing protein [Oceaniferula flavus]
MISNKEDLSAFLTGRPEQEVRVCAVDTEADSLHRYSESLCLVQFSDGVDHVLIDPLAIDDLSDLKTYLETATCWMHGADYDMHMLKQNLGMIPPVVYDTQIGARLLGVRKFGYGNLVEHYMGVELEKTSQKADWAKRPLTPVMEEYALNDVVYLLPMAEMIVSQLKEKGRYEWFTESCVAARDKALERKAEKTDRWRIKGSGKLDPKGLTFLRALWNWRDSEAESWDRPPFMVAGNKQLLDWVADLSEGRSPKMPRHYRSSRVKAFHAAVAKAKEVPAEEMPQKIRGKRRRKDPDFDSKLDALMAKRDRIAEELDIDSSLIAARAALEALAGEHEGAAEQLLPWQRNLLGI